MMRQLLLADIRQYGSMRENYDSETGRPLEPAAEHFENGVFKGFVGWNLLVQDMLEDAVNL